MALAAAPGAAGRGAAVGQVEAAGRERLVTREGDFGHRLAAGGEGGRVGQDGAREVRDGAAALCAVRAASGQRQ